jgi:apolipoprotein N-acyltransferase
VETLKRAALVALAVVGVALLCVGLYHGYWWLFEDSTDRRVGVTNRNLGTQTAWQDEARDKISTLELLPEDAPQRGGLEREACELIDRLTDSYLTDQLAAFEAANC